MDTWSPYPQVSHLAHQPEFNEIVGKEFSFSLLAESDLPLFHEACIYHPPTRSVFVTSNQLPNDAQSPNRMTSNKHVKLSRIFEVPGTGEAMVQNVTFPDIDGAMLNGGVNYNDDVILLCAQGTRDDAENPSGLLAVDVVKLDQQPIWYITSFYETPFNSLNDVVVHPQDRSMWFTDPCYGHHQGIRGSPELPNQVYRYDPLNGSCRVVADGFSRPNGLCFSPDLKILYVTDTGAIHGSSSVPFNPAGPSHIYAFDVVSLESKEPYLTNRRTFAYAPGKVPDGIKCDTDGNVYAGCGDGIEVWNPTGVFLGVIQVPGGVANFCFGEKGTVYACNETRFWKIQLNAEKVRGALLGM